MIYDLDRIKYYLKKYLRVRLNKIEKNIFYIVHSNLSSMFSNDEFVYACDFFKLI